MHDLERVKVRGYAGSGLGERDPQAQERRENWSTGGKESRHRVTQQPREGHYEQGRQAGLGHSVGTEQSSGMGRQSSLL